MQPAVAIVGLGLIGGSLARALKASGYTGRLSAVVRNPDSARYALDKGIVDAVGDNTAEMVKDAGIVVLAVPMLAMRKQLEIVRRSAPQDAVVSDVGSVKRVFVDEAAAVFGDLTRVVPAHPIAGAEQSGVKASREDLFRQRRVLLTPAVESAASAIDAVKSLWQLTGAMVECLDADHHDRVLAATSHLPHILAFTLVDALAKQQEAEEIFRYAAGGFRDFTRIAASDAIMWRDICLTNQQAVSQAIDAYSEHLDTLKRAIDAGDGEFIERIFRRAKEARTTHTGDV